MRDNETVYYEKAPIESELPTLIDKVLAKPAAVLQMVEERTLVPLPHVVYAIRMSMTCLRAMSSLVACLHDWTMASSARCH